MAWAGWLAASVRGEDENTVIPGQRRLRIADECVSVQIRCKRRVQPIFCDELTKRRALPGQCSEKLAEGLGLDFQFRDTGSLARNAQEFNIHDGG
jgi:hypothetical protein